LLPKKRPNRSSTAALRGRGFTLAEVVVALSAGVLVSIATLILARNATRFFQHEARISAAQLAVTLGLNRLTTDLQRASFLAAPTHSQGLDPKLCQEGGAVPATIRNWTGIAIRVRGSELDHPGELAQGAKAENDLHPDSIIIGGSLATTERFRISDASLLQVTLQNDEAIARLRTTAQNGAQTLLAALQPIFVSGRFLRIQPPDGGSVYGIIRGVNAVGPAPNEVVTITLDPSLPLVIKGINGKTCGLNGLGGGARASVVYRVQYDIRSLQGDPNYNRLVSFDPVIAAAISGEDTRTELVRVELDENGAEKPGSLELISELAVDLKLGVTKLKANTGLNPTVTTYPFEAPDVATTPELIRAVQVRLSTRTRVPDREVPLGPAGSQPYRFAVKDGPLTPRFARMRTLYANVTLPNQVGFSP
jgi:hypothetical protein